MVRYGLKFVMLLGLVGFLLAWGGVVQGNMEALGQNPPVPIVAPTLQVTLDEATQSLVIRGWGTPSTPCTFNLLYSTGNGLWSLLPPFPGFFDSSGKISLVLPLSAVSNESFLNLVADISVQNTSGPVPQTLISMPWGFMKRTATMERFVGGEAPLSWWNTWSMPLPGTSSPTFPISVGMMAAAGSDAAGTVNISVFTTGPMLALQAYVPGIEGMLPVN